MDRKRRNRGDGGLYKETISSKGHSYTYWIADWKDQDGKRHRASGATPEDALARKNLKLQLLSKEVKTKPRKSPSRGMTVSEAVSQWLAENQHIGETSRGKYLRNLTRYVIPFIGDKPIRTITRERIVELEAQQDAQGIGPSAKRHVWKNLNAMMRWAVRAGKIRTNPMEGIDPPKATNYRAARIEAHIDEHTRTALCIIAWTADKNCPYHWYHPIVMAMSLGLRRAELLGITREAIDLSSGSLEVRTRLMQRPGKGGYVLRPATKNGHSRVIKVPQPHYKALLEAREKHTDDAVRLPIEAEDGTVIGEGQLLFVREDGGPISYNQWNSDWREVQQAYKNGVCGESEPLTNGEYILPHEMRHIAASLLGEQGETLPTIQGILGHLTPEMTEHYSHILEKGREETAERWARTMESVTAFYGNFVRENAQMVKKVGLSDVDSGADSAVVATTYPENAESRENDRSAAPERGLTRI